jgi:hypothetical protein
VGSVFKAVASAFKAALKIPLVRAVIEIAVCASQVVAACVAIAGVMSLAAGGGIEDAIKAMAFSAVSMGSWFGTGEIIANSGLFGGAKFLFSTGLHGVVGGALSMMQGGTFINGFASGAIGQVAGTLSQSAFGPAGAGGRQGLLGRTAVAAIAGGTASELTGGKFANGAVTGAFGQLWNEEQNHTPRVSIDLYAHEIPVIGGVARLDHAFIVVSDGAGTYVVRAGPDSKKLSTILAGKAQLYAEVADYFSSNESKAIRGGSGYLHISKVAESGMTLSQVKYAFQEYVTKVNKANLSYLPLRQNSNTFAFGAIRAVGLSAPNPNPRLLPGSEYSFNLQ